MTSDPAKLPEDISQCHAMIRELLADSRKQQVLVEKLQHQMEQLLRARFGPRADRIHPDQLGLYAAEIARILYEVEPKQEEPKEKAAKPNRKGHGRNGLPSHLPREVVKHEVEASEKTCGTCGLEKVLIGEETSEQLEYRPASLFVLKHVRPVFACPKGCEGEVVTAPKPLQPIEKGLPGPGLLAQVATSKFSDHLPLNRQEDILARHGVEIPRSTQCDWMRSCAELVLPLFGLMKERVLSSRIIHTDDTPVRVRDKELTRTRTGRIWVYAGDVRNPYVVYDYTASRKRDGPATFLKSFAGYLQADAYGGYDGIYAGGAVKEVACWSHARRKFVECQSTARLGAVEAVAWIRRLYDVEDEAKGLSCGERLALRQEEAKPILDDFEKWLKEQKESVLPKSPFGEALGYTWRQLDALKRYLEDGELNIDNNRAERLLRCIAVGRNNWLFFGSDRGGKTAAVLYSFVSTCKDLHIDPFTYLADVFARISGHPANRLEELLPDRWKALREAAALQAAQQPA